MNMRTKSLLFALLVGLVIGVLWNQGRSAQESNLLTAKKVSKPPVLDGKVDAVWKEANAVKIPVAGGANLPNGSTEVTLKAVYTDTDIYFLAQ